MVPPESIESITPSRRVEGLRNLREGYDLVAAVGFWIELHGEDLIEEYAGLVEQLETAQDALRQIRAAAMGYPHPALMRVESIASRALTLRNVRTD